MRKWIIQVMMGIMLVGEKEPTLYKMNYKSDAGIQLSLLKIQSAFYPEAMNHAVKDHQCKKVYK